MEQGLKLYSCFFRDTIKKIVKSQGMITEIYRSSQCITQYKKVKYKPNIQKIEYEVRIACYERVVKIIGVRIEYSNRSMVKLCFSKT